VDLDSIKAISEFNQQVINGLSLGAIYALIALGYTMVFGVLRFINFAHGDLLMVGAYAGIFLLAGEAGSLANKLEPDTQSIVGVMPFWRHIYLWVLGGVLVLGLGIWQARGRKGQPFFMRPLYYLPLLTIAFALFLPVLGRVMFGAPDDKLPHTGWAIYVAVGAMLICGFFGMTIERLCYRPLRSQPRITVLITAIGMSLLLESLAQFGFGTKPQSFPGIVAMEPCEFVTPWKPSLWGHELFSVQLHPTLVGITISTGDLIVFGTTAILLLGVVFIVKFTKLGMAMRALAFNPTACSLMGVNTDFIISFTFGLGSAMAGVAGVLTGIQYSEANPLSGVMFGLKAFVAAVFGGIGSLPGAVLGGLVIGVLETLAIGYGFSTYKDGVAFAVLIVVLLVRPAGLLGKNIREKV
jgi:branched-chain amino acid transport system permease protein